MKFSTAISGIFGALTLTSIVLNAVWLAALALPAMSLWNAAVVPATEFRTIGYFRTLGLLLLWHLLRLAADGVTISAKTRSGGESR